MVCTLAKYWICQRLFVVVVVAAALKMKLVSQEVFLSACCRLRAFPGHKQHFFLSLRR